MPSREDDAAIRQAHAPNRKAAKKTAKAAEPKMKRGGHKTRPMTRGELNRVRKRRTRNKRTYAEVQALATELGIGLAPAAQVPDVLDKIFRRTHALWQHAATEVDKLDPDIPAGKKNSLWVIRFDDMGNRLVEPSKWVAYENLMRQELFEQAAIMQKLGIEEARVRIEAAQLQVLSQALKQAARNAGFTDEQQRKLGSALRQELEVIEGKVTDPDPEQIAA